MYVRWSRIIYRVVCATTVSVLAGCGSVVYKDAATTYVAAGRAASIGVADAAGSLANARDKLKAAQLVSDQTCPIAELHVYLRDIRLSKELKMALGLVPGMPVPRDCRRLLTCEAVPGSAGCGSVCYSAEEANCITTVEENLAIYLKGLTGAEADRFSMAAKPVAVAIAQSEYGRPKPVAAILVKENLDALTEYLDILEKLSVKRGSEVGENAKALSKRLGDTTEEISKLVGRQLSTEDKATQTKVIGVITATGKFVSDLQVISANAQDSYAIRRLVADQSKSVEDLISNIKAVAGSDAMLGAVFGNLALLHARQDLQDRYRKAADGYSRSLLLAERAKYSYSDGEQALRAVDELFDAMTRSHEALVQLVMNPSDKDRQSIANARFQEFKMIAKDVATLVQLFT